MSYFSKLCKDKKQADIMIKEINIMTEKLKNIRINIIMLAYLYL